VQRLKVYLLIKQRQAKRNGAAQKSATVLNSTTRLILALISISICVLFLAAGFFYAWLSNDLPSIEQLPVLLNHQNGELLRPTRLLDRSGQQVLATLGTSGEQRTFLSVNPDEPGHFSLQLLHLSVATLDPAFWTDDGVNTADLLDAQPQTIAERLVKELLLADEPDSQRTALRMKLLARQVTLRYGRTQVLEWYLNSANFGHSTFGAESAAQLYLGKSATDLNLAESALLVSLLESPALNPVDAPAAALENQQQLLKALFNNSVLSADEYQQASSEKLTFAPVHEAEKGERSGFVQYAEQQLGDLLGANRVARGGLDVITTLDISLQDQLECTTRQALVQIITGNEADAANKQNCPAAAFLPTQQFDWQGTADLLSASIVLDPKNGQILAYLAPFSLTSSSSIPEFQAGSLLSPFVTLAAFARGSSPATLVWDAPTSLPTDLSGAANPDGTFHGPVNYRLALANDYVVPISSIFNQIDAQTIWTFAASTGLNAPKAQNANASVLFGGGQTDLLQVAQAYATLAASGNKYGLYNPQNGQIEAAAILQVRSSNGQVLLDASQPQQSAVVSTSIAYLLNSILSDQTSRWTSLGHPNVLEVGKTVAVKLGQVQGKDQVWTVGYTPNTLVLTWLGMSASENSASNLDARMAAGVWRALFQFASADQPDEGWSRPLDVNEVQICSPSGMLPTALCPNITSDVFIAGNEPTQPDTLYEKLEVNRETGLLATVFTPASLVEERTFLNVPDTLRSWAESAGLAVPPLGYDTISTAPTNPNIEISSPSLFTAVHGKVTISGTANLQDLASFGVQFGQGINPDTWQQIGDSQTAPVVNGTLAEWDTAGLEGLYALRLNVVQKNNQIQTAVIQVTVDNTPPLVSIVSPQEGSKVTPSNGIVLLTANASDNVALERVEFWLDGKEVEERSVAPYTSLWTATQGSHTLQIKAFDSAGNESDSVSIQFTVLP
jgi:membrane peptidoglycan carboxypeptidase